MKRTVLVLSPHPDDMEIGMGGTVAKLVSGGAEVVSVVVTDGRRSTSVRGLGEEELARVRRAEAEDAARILSVSGLVFFELPDAKSEANERLLRQEFEAAIRQFKPAEIYMPHPEIDKHPTHQAVSQIALDVLGNFSTEELPLPGGIWAYEVWTPFPGYDRIEDISEYIKIKSDAINAHKSQVEYKNYTKGMKGLNRYRAAFDATSGISKMKYAEVFIRLNPRDFLRRDS